VALDEVLALAAPCTGCRSRGEQVFSFCLNRAVNADRVHHCLRCGKFFYYRPRFALRVCPYCDCSPLGHDAAGEEEEEEDEGARRAHEMRIAHEGYWGI
jgi:hypothetical protein